MQKRILLTPVDTLVEIIIENKKCSITFLKNKLNLPLEIIEKWLVILEEYKVIDIHYSGLEGYVTIIEDKKKNQVSEVNISNLKNNFIQRSKIKDVSYEKMKSLWPVFINEYESDIKRDFYEKAKLKGYDTAKIDIAWVKYKEDLKQL